MEKINFEDLPSKNTPVNATNLNQLQTNVEDAINGVIESASNENGSWIKFSDGTMICRIRKTITDVAFTEWSDSYSYSAAITLDLPQQFIDTRDLVSNVVCKSSNLCWTANVNTGTNDVTFYVLQNTPNTRSVNVEILTIGRWK